MHVMNGNASAESRGKSKIHSSTDSDLLATNTCTVKFPYKDHLGD